MLELPELVFEEEIVLLIFPQVVHLPLELVDDYLLLVGLHSERGEILSKRRNYRHPRF